MNNATEDSNASGSYYTSIAVQFAWSILPITEQVSLAGILLMKLTKDCLIYLPETPRYPIKMDRYDEAVKALGWLRSLLVDHLSIIEGMNEIQANRLYDEP